MNDRDIQLWQDRNTPCLAVSADGGICYLDNLNPAYGKPMYICKYKQCNASFERFESACDWFTWIKEQLGEVKPADLDCPRATLERAVIALES